MSAKWKAGIAVFFVLTTVLTIRCSNAGMKDPSPTKNPSPGISPGINLDDDEENCYEQMGGDGYDEVICG